MLSFRCNTNSRQIFLTCAIWETILSVWACDLHITHMPTQNIPSQLPLQVSYSEERKQTIVRVREVRNEEQQLCMGSAVSSSQALRQGPTKNLAPHPPTHPSAPWWQGLHQGAPAGAVREIEPVWVTRWYSVFSLRCLWIKTLEFLL